MKSILRSSALRVLVSIVAVALIVFMLRDKLGDALLILRRNVDWRIFFIASVIQLA